MREVDKYGVYKEKLQGVCDENELTYKISETFTISDALFSKLKNLFKNLHAMWMQHFYRDWIERPIESAVCENTACEQAEPTAEETSEDGDLYAAPTEEDTDELSEFFGENADEEE